jgi:transcriptional regulator with XRE-family HTH domain
MTMEGLRKENDDMPAKETRQEFGWAKLLEELRQDRNESYREASLAAGLDHGALHRFVRGQRRPNRESCIALANHFDINPNELLVAAGHEPLPWFDPSLTDIQDYPLEVKRVAEALIEIENLRLRREVCDALRALAQAMTGATPCENHRPLRNSGYGRR